MAAVAQIQIVVDDAQLAALGAAAQNAGTLIKEGLNLQEVQAGMQSLGYSTKETAAALADLGVSAQAAGPAIAAAGKEAVAFQDSMVGMRMTAALAGEEIGVRLPRALTSVAAHSTTLGPLLSAAFPVIAAIAFVEIAGRVAEKIAEMAARAYDWDGSLKQSLADQAALNAALTTQEQDLIRVNQQYALLGLTGIPRFGEQQDQAEAKVTNLTGALDTATKQLQAYQKQFTTAGLTQELPDYSGFGASTSAVGSPTGAQVSQGAQLAKTVADLTRQLQDAKLAAAQAGQALNDAIGDKQRKAAEDLAADIKKISDASMGDSVTNAQRYQLDQLALAQQHQAELDVAAQLDADDKIVAANAARIAKELDEDDKLYNRQRDDIQKFEDQTIDIQNRTADASVPPWAQAYAKIHYTMVKEMQQAQEQIQRLEDQHVITTEQGEQLMAQRMAAIQVQAQQEAVDKMAGQLQQFWDAITSGHLGQYFLKQFETLVFRMVATWILGISQMQQATQGGLFGSVFGGGGAAGGGLLGALGLGSLFGGAGSGAGASGASGNFDFLEGNTAALSSSAGGLSSTGGVAAPGAGSLLGGLAGGTGLASLLGPAGLILGGALTLGSSSSSLSSALSGGMLGAGIGGVIGLGLGAALAPFTLGLSLLAGGALGGILGGLFGSDAHSQGQKLRTQARSQIDAIVQSYDAHQTDYNSAMSELESLQQQTQKQLSQLGDNTNMPAFQTAEQQLQQTETQRQQRAGVAFGPAEFETGGLVGPLGIPWHAAVPYFAAADSGRIPSFASGGAVPIIAHAGEYVMSRPAVERIGTNKLAAMNAGASGDTHVHFNVSTMDARSFHDFLERGGGKVVLRHLRREVSEGR